MLIEPKWVTSNNRRNNDGGEHREGKSDNPLREIVQHQMIIPLLCGKHSGFELRRWGLVQHWQSQHPHHTISIAKRAASPVASSEIGIGSPARFFGVLFFYLFEFAHHSSLYAISHYVVLLGIRLSLWTWITYFSANRYDYHSES